MSAKIEIPKDKIAEFCLRNHIRSFAFFGSVLRESFGLDSDIDVLVEFDHEYVPGLFGIARLERELSILFEGRRVDLRTPGDLSRYFRKNVLAEAEVLYAQG